jgi:TonB-dependent SusC/RagA subfamily outer membrane receptor
MLKTAIIQSLLPVFYRLLMQRDTFHKMVRCYFMGGLILSYILPLIRFDFRILPPLQNNVSRLLQSAQPVIIEYQYVEVPAANAGVQWWQQYSLADVLMTVLVAGMTVMLIRFIIQCLSLGRMSVSRHCRYKTHSIINVDMPVKPFSFVKRIYINPHLHTAGELDEIIRHELVHVNQYHSVDIIIATINRIIFWWNPLVMILNSDIRNNLEYIVDDEMLKNGTNRKHYQYNILNISQMTYMDGIANYFNLHNLKKRIEMMNKEKTQPVYKIKWLLLLPVATLILLSFNMKRAVATNVDFAVNSEIPESESIIEADTVKSETLIIIGSDSIILSKKDTLKKVFVFGEIIKVKGNVVEIEVEGEEGDTARFFTINTSDDSLRNSSGRFYANNDSLFKKPPKDALIIIDGKELDIDHFKSLDQAAIHSLSILKDKVAIKLYGKKGENGVIIVETKDECKTILDTTQFFIRGISTVDNSKDPLIIIDGKETDASNLKNLEQENIHSFSILKDKTAIELYGEKAKNGVIIIETKRNESKNDSLKNLSIKNSITDIIIIDGKEADMDMAVQKIAELKNNINIAALKLDTTIIQSYILKEKEKIAALKLDTVMIQSYILKEKEKIAALQKDTVYIKGLLEKLSKEKLIIIDGKEADVSSLENLDPEIIHSFSIEIKLQ